MTTLREFIAEFLVITISIVLGVISMILPNVTQGEQYIVWTIGAITTMSAVALKRELLARFDERTELYRLLENIKDDELHAMGDTLVEECKRKLEDLSKGTFRGGISEIFGQAVMRIRKTKTKIQATHVISNLSHLYVYTDSPIVANYYEENVNAVNKGIKIERLFILDKELLIDPITKKIKDERGVDIIKKQNTDNIHVTIVWREDLPSPDLIEDFIIFDNSVVQVEQVGTTKELYKGVAFTKNPSDITFYEQKFMTMKLHGQPVDKVFNSSMTENIVTASR